MQTGLRPETCGVRFTERNKDSYAQWQLTSGLVKELKDGVKIFIREEIQTGQNGDAEKIVLFWRQFCSRWHRRIRRLCGLIILLAGLGAVLSLRLQPAGPRSTAGGFHRLRSSA